jgi:mono/diheme cytochrome c family protein
MDWGWCVPGAADVLPRFACLLALLLAGCAEERPDLDLADDAGRYVGDVDYRRGVLERDLHLTENDYAQRRLDLYALEGEGWDALPERDRPTRLLSTDDTDLLEEGSLDDLDLAEVAPFGPTDWPTHQEAWIDLGRDVIARYPLRADPVYEALAGIPGGLERAGFFTRGDGTWVGLAVFEDEVGQTRIGPTCGQCHCSIDRYGVPSPTVANKEMDLGAAWLLARGFDPDEPPDDVEGTPMEAHYALGPGRADVLSDSVFNPFAYPDLGGLADMPYLQQNANWIHGGLATVAIRAETLFITSNSQRSRIPRELSWAAGAFFRSFGPPEPLTTQPGPAVDAGAQIFEDTGCGACHTPPLYTSDRLVTIEEVGTDPDAGTSRARYTGYYRIPSLRGVSRTAPYLHHGAVRTLDELLSPDRDEPGHRYGTDLDEQERADLVAFLRSI